MSRSADPSEHIDAGLLRIAGVCILASVMAILDVTVVSVAQRTFIGVFDTSQAMAAWTMTGYTLALATVIPLTGWAANRFGTKRLFIGSVLLFTLGSLLCALATSIGALVAFRVIQGLGGGMLTPLTFTILAREAGPRRLGRLMAILGVPMLLGPIAGPILGGWLIDSLSWPWIFGINLPLGVLAGVLAAVVFPPDEPRPGETLDVTGLALLSPGLAALLFGVSSLPGSRTPGAVTVWLPAAIGLALLAAFVGHARRVSHPLVDLRLFARPVVRRANATMFLFGIAFFGTGLVFPSYFQQAFGQNAASSGLHLAPQAIGAMVTMPIAGRVMDRYGPRWVVLAGIIAVTAGLALFAVGVTRHGAYAPMLLTALVVMGMGLGATMMPASGAAVRGLDDREVARGSTLINVNQQTAGSIGTALMSVIVTARFDVRDHPGAGAGNPSPRTGPGFAADLAAAYGLVFVVATVIVACCLLVAARLPATPAEAARTPEELAEGAGAPR